MDNLTSDQKTRVDEIRARVQKSKDLVKKDAHLEGNKLVIGLEFDDEGDLLQQWLQAVADCNSLLCILDGGKPI